MKKINCELIEGSPNSAHSHAPILEANCIYTLQ